RQIVEAISGLDATWPVLFFGCSVEHAKAIAVLLRRSGREAAAITAQTREATRRQLVEAFRCGEIQVLCNYGVLRQIVEAISGLDATWPVLFFGCSVEHAKAIAVLL
ncbi:hypothetical protein, partial [Streptococcus pneumoniae]|uniref:hypothetical protein n=1 Tax=Streptococcus pneumoniae TaxID=1313 RepID=UPI001CB77E43